MAFRIVSCVILLFLTNLQALPLPNATSNHSTVPPSPSVDSVEFLGDVHSATTYVKRDLGFQGQLGPYVLLSYGDTMFSDAKYGDDFRGMTSDSVALATKDPLVVIDPDLDENGHPPQFCPIMKRYGENGTECALGITNVVETSPGEGILYFLLNHRPEGKNHIIGAGVASVTVDTSCFPPKPRIERLPPQYWWDAEVEPWYGDICSLGYNGYVYAYGHGGESNPWIYLTRVPVQDARSLDCYEYWNGEGWQKERLKTKDLTEKESMFWQINQGQVVWSEYFQCFIFVYSDNWMNSKVLMKSAAAPEGPWSEPLEIYQATPITPGSSTYAAIPHPYFDPSGKTLVVTFTNHPNTIQAIRVTFG